MSKYASGKYALAICDICGLKCDYLDLRIVIRDGKSTGLQSCKECVDKSQPKTPKHTADAQALRRPRPENWDASRRILNWKPVDGPWLNLQLGNVVVETTTTLPPLMEGF